MGQDYSREISSFKSTFSSQGPSAYFSSNENDIKSLKKHLESKNENESIFEKIHIKIFLKGVEISSSKIGIDSYVMFFLEKILKISAENTPDIFKQMKEYVTNEMIYKNIIDIQTNIEKAKIYLNSNCRKDAVDALLSGYLLIVQYKNDDKFRDWIKNISNVRKKIDIIFGFYRFSYFLRTLIDQLNDLNSQKLKIESDSLFPYFENLLIDLRKNSFSNNKELNFNPYGGSITNYDDLFLGKNGRHSEQGNGFMMSGPNKTIFNEHFHNYKNETISKWEIEIKNTKMFKDFEININKY